MADIQDNLLRKELSDILCTLSQKTKVGICSPDNIGHNRPSFTMVFLCPHQTPAALCRLFSVMAGCIGQPLKRLAGSYAGTANLMQPATQCFAALIGGYPFYIGVRNMSQNNSPLHSGQNIQAQTEQITQNSTNHQPKTIADLHQTFAELCLSYGTLGRNISAERNNEALSNIIDDCENLSSIAALIVGGAR